MKQPYHYLVVDDDTTSNLICSFTIQRFQKNAVVQLFTKPEEALQFIKDKEWNPENDPTILFLDVNMPGMTGFEFLEELQGLGKEIKEKFRIYMLTSSVEELSMKTERFPMIKGFLSKPINISYLKDIQLEL